jgi:dihydrofolate reductase
MNYTLVAALGKNRELGLNNNLLWRLPEDLKNFKALTIGKTMVMGRKTFESIGKPLPKRETIILTRDKSYTQDGCVVLHSLEEVDEYAKENDLGELMIVGGGEIYKLYLERSQVMYLSFVDYDGQADTFFPEFDQNEWNRDVLDIYEAGEKTLSWKFCKYSRRL